MNRNKKKREIKYPKLFECSQLEQDDYWKQFFENLSRGKSIKKLLLTDTNIEITQKNKSVVYVYKDKTPETILIECKELIRQKLHLHSKKDIYNNQQKWTSEQNELNNLTQQDDWKKIRNKNMRYFLIMKYAIQTKNTKNINWKIANKFFKTIIDALYNIHTHKSIDVVMQNGVITNIKDIVISENNIICNLRLDSNPSKKEKKDVKLTLWEKYLSNITKMYSESKFDNSLLSEYNNSKSNDDNEEINFIENSCMMDDDEYETFNTL
jgi:hypothetical protein